MSDPNDKPGFVVVQMIGDAVNDAAALDAQAEQGYNFVAFYSVAGVTNALMSRGYKN